MTPTPTDDMRREFEAWADAEGFNILRYEGGAYVSPRTERYWDVWKACCATRPVPAGVVEALIAAAHTEVFHGSGAQMSIALDKAIALVKAHAQLAAVSDKQDGMTFEQWFEWKFKGENKPDYALKSWLEVAWNGANYNKQPVRVDLEKCANEAMKAASSGNPADRFHAIARAVLSVVKDAAKEMGVELEIV